MAINPFSETTEKRLATFCQPLMETMAFQRLGRISFLGILSPKYKTNPRYPFRLQALKNDDGSRLDHSIKVALIALETARQLNFSEETQRYAACWGLLHDIATWPLSHTGEAAFSSLFNLSGRALREQMILGSDNLDSCYHLDHVLRQIGVNAVTLLQLFSMEDTALTAELLLFKNLIHSPITPDTLEGIYRSGRVWNVNVPRPYQAKTLKRDLFQVYLTRKSSRPYISFWKKKSVIYEKFINNNKTIQFESTWSYSIKEYFKHITLSESLELDETVIISRVLENGLLDIGSVLKYKSPQIYCIRDNIKSPGSIRISELSDIFIKKEKYGTPGLPALPARTDL